MLLVIDVEATCWDKVEMRSRSDMEIIEIGATLLMDAQLTPLHRDSYAPTFSTFIRPVKFPVLSDFCRKLTSIRQEDVDNAEAFPEALESFLRSVCVYLGAEPINHIIWGSWGNYEKNQMFSDCNQNGVKYPFGRHWNIKRAYSEERGSRKGFGVRKALAHLNMEFEGTQHRGVDDSIMISKIVRQTLNDKYRDFRDGRI
jgi:inhibitor of KinA sporulation pathway (predicted exonuclease)